MGFFYRKSVNLGPFRVNLSGSGVGYSVGGRGVVLARALAAVWEGNELRLIIAPGVDRPGEVDVNGDNAIVWC